MIDLEWHSVNSSLPNPGAMPINKKFQVFIWDGRCVRIACYSDTMLADGPVLNFFHPMTGKTLLNVIEWSYIPKDRFNQHKASE
jgi:hypothetical protein